MQHENNLKQSLFLSMGNIFNMIRQYLDQRFKPYGLARAEWVMLAVLRVYPTGIDQHEARSHVGVEKSYFTKVLNILESRQFIIREVDLNDRRNRILKANPKAPRELKEIFQIMYEVTNDIQQDLNEQELNALHHAFERILIRLGDYQPTNTKK